MARTPTEQQMEAAARSYFNYVTKGDIEGILSLFAEDALMINPMTGEQGIRGKAALRAFYQNLTGSLVDYHAGLQGRHGHLPCAPVAGGETQ